MIRVCEGGLPVPYKSYTMHLRRHWCKGLSKTLASMDEYIGATYSSNRKIQRYHSNRTLLVFVGGMDLKRGLYWGFKPCFRLRLAKIMSVRKRVTKGCPRRDQDPWLYPWCDREISQDSSQIDREPCKVMAWENKLIEHCQLENWSPN